MSDLQKVYKESNAHIAAVEAALAALPDGVVKSYIQANKTEVAEMMLAEFEEENAMAYLREKVDAEDKNA